MSHRTCGECGGNAELVFPPDRPIEHIKLRTSLEGIPRSTGPHRITLSCTECGVAAYGVNREDWTWEVQWTTHCGRGITG